jgi:hypothetical protein
LEICEFAEVVRVDLRTKIQPPTATTAAPAATISHRLELLLLLSGAACGAVDKRHTNFAGLSFGSSVMTISVDQYFAVSRNNVHATPTR